MKNKNISQFKDKNKDPYIKSGKTKNISYTWYNEWPDSISYMADNFVDFDIYQNDNYHLSVFNTKKQESLSYKKEERSMKKNKRNFPNDDQENKYQKTRF